MWKNPRMKSTANLDIIKRGSFRKRWMDLEKDIIYNRREGKKERFRRFDSIGEFDNVGPKKGE